VGFGGRSKIVEHVESKAHERMVDTGDESREYGGRWLAKGEGITNFHETAMEYFSSMLHR